MHQAVGTGKVPDDSCVQRSLRKQRGQTSARRRFGYSPLACSRGFTVYGAEAPKWLAPMNRAAWQPSGVASEVLASRSRPIIRNRPEG